MQIRPIAHASVVAGVLAAILVGPLASRAVADEYFVGNCLADELNYNTRAFDSFVTRGMKITRACAPQGRRMTRMPGLTTTNVVRRGRLPRGSVALASITAPAGTSFTTFRWGGTFQRTDCRYALQLVAAVPGDDPIPLKNVRANQKCPNPRLPQAAGFPTTMYDVPGATRIVQRVICVGDDRRKSCSARGSNYIRTNEAEVGIADFIPPAAVILGDTPLARGEWVGGRQPLSYDANDNVGVRRVEAVAGGRSGGFHERPCAFAVPEEVFADKIPCPNGPGQIGVDTTALPEGSHALVARARDTADNLVDSAAVTARIDNTPPGRVDLAVEGHDAWRNRNDFAVTWANRPEDDRAPITTAMYEVCPTASGECIGAEQAGADISRVGLAVPAAGEWAVSLWLRDAAGNESRDAASVPVKLRFDPEPPQLGFEPMSASDPTLVAASVTDVHSGLADGGIEISAGGSGAWQALPTQEQGSHLVARIDDAALPAGSYHLRARAVDHAGNEASTDRTLDGSPMAITLPLRIVSSMQAAFERERVIERMVRRHGKRRVVRRRVPVLAPTARIRAGGGARVAGRLVNADGDGIAGAEVRVFASSSVSPEQLVAVLHTDSDGHYRYTAGGSSSRTLRFAYAGTPLILPAERSITMRVPARTSMRVNRRRVLNGQSVTFRGRLRTQPAPPGGKLVELQVRLSDRWQTFRTSRTDAAGRWAIGYRFKRTRGVQRFLFRARLPREASYPFVTGGSRPVSVRVRGL